MQHLKLWKKNPLLRLNLQFFAEGSADGGGAEGGQASAAGSPEGGTNGASAATNQANAAKMYTPEDAAAVAKQFKMIPHNAVRPRYKTVFDNADKYEAFKTHFGAVAEKFGVSMDDPEGLAKAILQNPELVRAKAIEMGSTEEVAAKALKDETDAAITRAKLREYVEKEEFKKLEAEEKAVKEAYPNFDMTKASENKAFKTLVDSGMPMKEAYEMSFHSELTAAAIQVAKEQAKAEAKAEMEGMAARPKEGAREQTSNAGVDVSKLHGKELDDFLESFLTR